MLVRASMGWLLLVPSVAIGADILVGPQQTYATIQAGIDAASPADRVLVDPGTYDEILSIRTSDLTIESVAGADQTIITSTALLVPGLNDNLVTVGSVNNVVLRGFTIDAAQFRRGVAFESATGTLDAMVIHNGFNSDGFPGGGLDLYSGSTVEVLGSTFEDNRSTSDGGHIAVEQSSDLSLVGSTLLGGNAFRGGAIAVVSGGTAEIDSTVFENNVLDAGSSACGGALYVGTLSLVVLQSSTLQQNQAAQGKGGATHASGLFLSLSNQYLGNQAFKGGAASVGPCGLAEGFGVGDYVDVDSSFVENDADWGGAVYCGDGLNCELNGSLLESNAAAEGGGLYAFNNNVQIEGATLCTNVTTSRAYGAGRGGGLYAEQSYVDVLNNVFFGNQAEDGGGAVHVRETDLLSVNNHYVANTATTGGGAYHNGSQIGFDAQWRSINDLVAWNDGGGGSVVVGPVTYWSMDHGYFWGNLNGNASLALTGSNLQDIEDPWLAGGVPQACDVPSMYPTTGSRLIDGGDPSVLDPDGSISDIGAFGGVQAEPGLWDDSDADGVADLYDCDDADPNIFDATTWWPDADGDRYGDPAGSVQIACTQPDGFVDNDGDCDDTNASVSPETLWWPDTDLDGLGDLQVDGTPRCEKFEGWVDNALDCDDTTDLVGGVVDTYLDEDLDGFGSDATVLGCPNLPGYSLQPGDCDPVNPEIYPGAPEYCDDVDQDCDGETQDSESVDATAWSPDLDGDGFGDDTRSERACVADPSLTDQGGDCDDSDDTIHPNADEIWYDGIDQNCDEADDFDQDGDGFVAEVASGGSPDCDDTKPEIHPDAVDEFNDGIDQDCDGVDRATWVAGGGSGCDTTAQTGGSVWLWGMLALFIRKRSRAAIRN